MKLITRPECPHCDAVKEFIAKDRPDFKMDIEILQTKVAESEYAMFSKSAPILISDWYFVAGSHKIIDHIQTLN